MRDSHEGNVLTYNQEALKKFLKAIGCEFMISGHGHVTEHTLDNQFRLNTGRGDISDSSLAYMVISSKKPIRDALKNPVKTLDGKDHDTQVKTGNIKDVK